MHPSVRNLNLFLTLHVGCSLSGIPPYPRSTVPCNQSAAGCSSYPSGTCCRTYCIDSKEGLFEFLPQTGIGKHGFIALLKIQDPMVQKKTRMGLLGNITGMA